MEIVEFGPMTPERRAELEGDEADPFGAAGATLQFRPKERHVALQDAQGRLVASAGMLVVDVEVSAHQFPVVGIGGVIVKAEDRGRGYAREIVQAALAQAQALGPAFVIFFCHADRAGLYRRLGFTEISDEVFVEQPGGYTPMPQRTMWRSLRPGATFPGGRLMVRSLPF